MYALMLLGMLATVCTSFVVLFTGKQTEGLQDALNLNLGYQARAWAYMLYLTEGYPPFSPKDAGTEAVPAPVNPEPASS